jgi:hypothetical protein
VERWRNSEGISGATSDRTDNASSYPTREGNHAQQRGCGSSSGLANNLERAVITAGKPRRKPRCSSSTRENIVGNTDKFCCSAHEVLAEYETQRSLPQRSDAASARIATGSSRLRSRSMGVIHTPAPPGAARAAPNGVNSKIHNCYLCPTS